MTDQGKHDIVSVCGRTFNTKSFTSDGTANAYLKQHTGWGVIAVVGGTVHAALKTDNGVKHAN